jgi:hypothetical protein
MNFNVAKGDLRLSGTIVDVDPDTGHANGIQRAVVCYTPEDSIDIRVY